MAPISSDYPIVSSGGGGGTWTCVHFTANGTFTRPSDAATVMPIFVQATGGGGGGGGGGGLTSYSNIHSHGDGGGGGGSAIYQQKWMVALNNITVVIGAGGVAGAAGGTADGGQGGVGGTTKLTDATTSKLLLACLGAEGGHYGQLNSSGSYSMQETPTAQGSGTWVAGMSDNQPMGSMYPTPIGSGGVAPIPPAQTDGYSGGHSALYRSGDVDDWDKTGYAGTPPVFDFAGTSRGAGDTLSYGWPQTYAVAMEGSSAGTPQPHAQAHGNHGSPSEYGPGMLGGIGGGYGVGGIVDSSTRGPTSVAEHPWLSYGSGGGGGGGGWSNDGGSDMGATPGGLGLVGGVGYHGYVAIYYYTSD